MYFCCLIFGIHHNNSESYIIGTYIPIEPNNIDNKDTYKIKMQNGQLILSIKEARLNEDGINIKVGKAVKDNL